MDVQTSLNRIEELFRIMYLGLWVLWAETRWIAGPDIGYQRVSAHSTHRPRYMIRKSSSIRFRDVWTSISCPPS